MIAIVVRSVKFLCLQYSRIVIYAMQIDTKSQEVMFLQ